MSVWFICENDTVDADDDDDYNGNKTTLTQTCISGGCRFVAGQGRETNGGPFVLPFYIQYTGVAPSVGAQFVHAKGRLCVYQVVMFKHGYINNTPFVRT